MVEYEKLGAFYLGRLHDLASGETSRQPLLYDSKDLTTHAVCVGMTGSGKTGLCLSLLEEAAIDGVPAIAIDPKGDLGNLLLAFPDLAAEDFLPWIDESAAARKGQQPAEFAKSTAALWQQGLAEWDQSGERIARYREAADVAIFTPGSNAGLPLTVLKSFAAPPEAVREDADAFRERIAATSSGVLALLGINADPVRSREHILLSNVLSQAWLQGRDLDIAGLIREIHNPAFDRVGILDLETFFPADDRLELAMQFNNLLASPTFASWLEGDPLDIQRLLYTPNGKPRIAILSIAHLSDAERMFFVTIVLNEVLAWMRSQPGTSSLRALLYMDEVFGYFPPSANPPSKKPMLTLLKQARAFGLGCVLATQNPVDLDYKGLSNAGTWFLGRLQTERDKLRVLEGLEGASASAGSNFDRGKMEATLAGLGSRVFLMNNVHDDAPVVFHTRWAMSYLRGPLTRSQIKTLMAPRKAEPTSPQSKPAEASTSGGATPAASSRPVAAARKRAVTSSQPILDAEIEQQFATRTLSVDDPSKVVYRPGLCATARLHYVRATYDIDHWQDVLLIDTLHGAKLPKALWETALELPHMPTCDAEPEAEASFARFPSELGEPKEYRKFQRSLKDFLYRSKTLTVLRSKSPKAYSQPPLEDESAFRGRLRHLAREERDLQLEKLRAKHQKNLAKIEARIDRAEDKVEREQTQYSQAKTDTAVSFGSSLLGALFGRKLKSSANVTRASSSARKLSKAAKEKQDVEQAEEALADFREQLQAAEDEFKAAAEEITRDFETAEWELEETVIKARKSELEVSEVSLIWLPWVQSADGPDEPAW